MEKPDSRKAAHKHDKLETNRQVNSSCLLKITIYRALYYESMPYPRAPAQVDMHVHIEGFVLDMLGLDATRVQPLFIGVGCHSADGAIPAVNSTEVLKCIAFSRHQ